MAKIDNVIDSMLAGDVQKQLEKNSSKTAVIASTAIISLALVAMRTIPEIINYLETCNTNGRADMAEVREHELKIKEMELERLAEETKMQYSDKLMKMEEQISKAKAEAEKWRYYYQESLLDLEKLRKGGKPGTK